jgi:hypothetical protein
MSGALGKRPSHAARASLMCGGTQRGSAGAKAFMSSPASSNKPFQSGAAAPAAPSSTCGGTASKASRRPSVSSARPTMPETSGGGSWGVTLMSPRGSRGRRLCLYQKRNAPGWFRANLRQRSGERSRSSR